MITKVFMDPERGLGMMTIGSGDNRKERPFHILSQRQKKMFTDTLNIGVDDFWTELEKTGAEGMSTTTQIITTAFIWSALYAGAIRLDRKCDFTYDDVIDWIEEAEDAEADEIGKPWVLLRNQLAKKNEELMKMAEQYNQQPK